MIPATPVVQSTTMNRPVGLNLQQQSPNRGIHLANSISHILPHRASTTCSCYGHASQPAGGQGASVSACADLTNQLLLGRSCIFAWKKHRHSNCRLPVVGDGVTPRPVLLTGEKKVQGAWLALSYCMGFTISLSVIKFTLKKNTAIRTYSDKWNGPIARSPKSDGTGWSRLQETMRQLRKNSYQEFRIKNLIHQSRNVIQDMVL